MRRSVKRCAAQMLSAAAPCCSNARISGASPSSQRLQRPQTALASYHHSAATSASLPCSACSSCCCRRSAQLPRPQHATVAQQQACHFSSSSRASSLRDTAAHTTRGQHPRFASVTSSASCATSPSSPSPASSSSPSPSAPPEGSSSSSTTVTSPHYPPFSSALPAPEDQVPPCDAPELNPAVPPSQPPLPGPLSSHRPEAVRRLLIYKKVTTLEEIRRGIKRSVDFPYLQQDAKVLAADREHQHTLAVVRESVALSGADWKEVEVIGQEEMRWADCIVCVGGDGTFLKASRHIAETADTPIVGVNSAPSSSFGFFSAVDHHSFPALLPRLLDGSALICPLWRARLCVNMKPIGHPVLNEILFCNPIPSATTRYLLTNGGITQLQQSSGIWISTAGGSTGAILGAGGQLMHLSDWRFQYRVRELFSLPITHPRKLEQTDFPHIHYNSSSASPSAPLLQAGFLAHDFHFISRMMSGCLYLDGSIIAIPVQFNDRVSVRRSQRPLLWLCPTKEGQGEEQIDHWEIVTGLRRQRMPNQQQIQEGLSPQG